MGRFGTRLAGAILLSAGGGGAWAGTSTWIAGSSNWNNAANWQPAAVPVVEDVAIVHADGVPRTVTFDLSDPTTFIRQKSLAMDLTGGSGTNAVTLAIGPAGYLRVDGNETFGDAGRATVVQAAGYNRVGPFSDAKFYLGKQAGSVGTYRLQSGDLSMEGVTNYEYIGYSGAGNFVQSGGLNVIAGQAVLGVNVGAIGTYALGGGEVFVAAGGGSNGNLTVGFNGAGTVTQSGGTNTMGSGGNFAPLNLGYNPGSDGSYTLGGGTLTQRTGSPIFVGLHGHGAFAQTGGVLTAGGTYVAANPTATGEYATTGGVGTVKGDVLVGSGSTGAAGGVGKMTVGGTGDLTVNGKVKVWDAPGNVLNLTGGSLTARWLELPASPDFLNWGGGALRLVGPGTTALAFPVAVPSGGLLSVSGSAQVTVAGAIKVANAPLTKFALAAGGSATATAIDLSGNAAGFAWTGGLLRITGSGSDFAGPLTVPSGGTLAGGGAITDPVVVGAGGAVSPGNSPGLLSTGPISFTSGATLIEEITGPTPGVGGYDRLAVAGTVTLGGGTLSVSLGYTPALGTTFVIIDNDGIDPVLGTFAGLSQGATFSKSDPLGRPQLFRIDYAGGDGNDATLTAVAAPEPAALGIFVFGGLAGLCARRRTRRAGGDGLGSPGTNGNITPPPYDVPHPVRGHCDGGSSPRRATAPGLHDR